MQDNPTGQSIGSRLFGLPKNIAQLTNPGYKLFGKMGDPLHEPVMSLLGFRKNNSPIEDVQQALALGRPVSDQAWINAGYGPGGLGYWQGTNYPGARPNVGATGGPPMVAMPAGYQDKLMADPVYRRAIGLKKGGSVKHPDAAQDKALVRKGVAQHEAAMHKGQPKTALRLNSGGSVDRAGMRPITKLKAGGKVA